MSKSEFNKDKVLSKIQENKLKTLEAIGLFVEGDAKLRCPVDTGNLRSSITHVTDEEKTTIGTNVEYAIWQEKGSSRTKAQPFLTPAVENNKGTIQKIVKEMMKI